MNLGTPPLLGLPLPVYTIYYPTHPVDINFYTQTVFPVVPSKVSNKCLTHF